MPKILWFSLPGHGHVNPTLPVITGLTEHGAEIIYANTEVFRPQIERAGASFRPYPLALPDDAITQAVERNLLDVTKLLMTLTEQLTDTALNWIDREQPDLVIYDSLALWGRLAAQQRSVRTVASITTFILEGIAMRPTWPDMRDMLGAALRVFPAYMSSRRRLSQRYGGLPEGPVFPARGDLNIVYTARELQPPTDFIDDSFRFVGPSINPATRPVAFPYDQLDGRPLIYISLGTVNNGNYDFYAQVFTAFADYPAQFVLSVGPLIALENLPTVPPNFIVRPAVPQLEILRRTEAFITHAGMNSLQEALYYGVPLVMVPQQMEQAMNARIAAAAGVGTVLADRPPYGKRLATADLRRALDDVLTVPSYRASAQHVSQALQAAGGYHRAIDEILTFAGVMVK